MLSDFSEFGSVLRLLRIYLYKHTLWASSIVGSSKMCDFSHGDVQLSLLREGLVFEEALSADHLLSTRPHAGTRTWTVPLLPPTEALGHVAPQHPHGKLQWLCMLIILAFRQWHQADPSGSLASQPTSEIPRPQRKTLSQKTRWMSEE